METIEVESKETGWLTTEQAAQRLELSRRVFEMRCKGGEYTFPRYKVAGDRQYYYDPNDLAAVRQDEVLEMSRDAPAAALLGQAYSHNEMLVKLHLDMTRQLLQHQTDENQKLRDRCAQLEQTQIDLIQAREDMLNDQHARDLATKELQDSSERKDKALAWLIELAPTILQTHMASKMQSGAVRFLQSITVEQIEMLIGLNEMSKSDDETSETMLSEEQEEMLKALLEQKKKEAGASEGIPTQPPDTESKE